MLERFLLVWLCLLALVALAWPEGFAWSKPYLQYLFAATMFAIGWLLPRDEVRQVARRWPAVLFGTAVQYVSMPLLAWSLGHLFGLEGDLLVGVILVGCVPGAMASNVLTLAARGNTSYSISLTTCATLLSPVVVPLATYLTMGRELRVSAGQQCLDLLLTVVLPVVAGYLISRRLEAWRRVFQPIGSTIANLTILWIIGVVVALNAEKLRHVDPWLLTVLLLINVLGYAAGWLAGRAARLPEGMRRALTLEIGMQNAGLGAVMAGQWFHDRPAVAIPCAIYTFGCMFTGTLLARWWAWRSEKEEVRVESQTTDTSDLQT